MLKDDLFTIINIEHKENNVEAQLKIDDTHSVFDGHFPEHPVLPGVCLTQMIKETLEQVLNVGLQLTKAAYVKFSGLVDPRVNNLLIMKVSYSTKGADMNVSIAVTAAGKPCLKMQAEYIRLFPEE